ncbi:class I SAM-dependent methyltransferase [Pseudorhodoplanes sp.]|uniref:class I SAM-dependent methyltransferase n=1 Tax=Pseudorhodoplanes sp. TaxID=1934341 RepID=UPI003918A556
MGLYRRYIGPRLIGYACSRSNITGLRQSIVPQASGVVLEIGIGPGLNLAHYDPGKVKKVIGIDPEPGFLELGRKQFEQSPVPVEIVQAPGETLPLDDGIADCAVLTYTLCSVGDPVAALLEIRRVLKPGGRLLFLEHGRSDDANIAQWQDRLNPLWNVFSCGCQINRDTAHLLSEAGFRIEDADRFYLPGAPKILGFHCRGTAVSMADARAISRNRPC